MVNSRQALSSTRVLVTMYALAIASTSMVASAVIGVPGVISDIVGVQRADVAGTIIKDGVAYDVLRQLSVVVDVAALPPGVVFPGPAVACTLSEAALTAGVTLAPTQPTPTEVSAVAAGATTFSGNNAATTTGATAVGVVANAALGLGGQSAAHLLDSTVPVGVVIARGPAALDRLSFVIGTLVRLIAIGWALYVACGWLWARRPAALRGSWNRPAVTWGRA